METGEGGWWLSVAQTADKVDTGESCCCFCLLLFGAAAAQVGGGYYIKKLLLPHFDEL